MNKFSEVLEFCIQKKYINSRLKGFLLAADINSLESLNSYLKKPLQNPKINKYGAKTIFDLKVFQDLLIKMNVESENLPIQVDVESSEFKHHINEIILDLDLDKRTKKILDQIINESDFVQLISNRNGNTSFGYLSKRVLKELEQVYSQLKIKPFLDDKETKNILQEFKQNIGIVIFDPELIKDLASRQLNIKKFIEIYFESLFSELSKSAKNKLRNIFFPNKAQLTQNVKILTKERIRQINKGIEKIDLVNLSKKLKFICQYSNKNLEINDDLISYSEYVSDRYYEIFNDDSDKNLMKFIIFVINYLNYIILNEDKLTVENINAFYKIDEIIFLKKEFLNLSELSKFKDEVRKILNDKNYRQIFLADIFNDFNSYPILYTRLIKKYLLNYFGNTLILEDNLIRNKKKQSLAILISSFLKKENIPKSADEILKYCKAFEGFDNLSIKEIQYSINRNKNLFYNIGKTRFYGLLTPERKSISSIKAECYNILSKADSPLYQKEIIAQLKILNTRINDRTVYEILRMYDCFKSIGQSFFILSSDSRNYELPVNAQKFINGLHKLFSSQNDWIEIDTINDYFDSVRMPNYQKSAYIKHLIVEYNGFATIKLDSQNIDSVIKMLADNDVMNILKQHLKAYNYFNEIDLRLLLNSYIEKKAGIKLPKSDLSLIIKFYQKITDYGI